MLNGNSAPPAEDAGALDAAPAATDVSPNFSQTDRAVRGRVPAERAAVGAGSLRNPGIQKSGRVCPALFVPSQVCLAADWVAHVTRSPPSPPPGFARAAAPLPAPLLFLEPKQRSRSRTHFP